MSTDIPQFEESDWQSDKNGCQGLRSAMIEQLEQAKGSLKGLSEDEISSLLGKPDRNELYKRNQKFFIYDIKGSKSCEAQDPTTTYTYLSIRFNATGLAKEVLIYTN